MFWAESHTYSNSNSKNATNGHLSTHIRAVAASLSLRRSLQSTSGNLVGISWCESSGEQANLFPSCVVGLELPTGSYVANVGARSLVRRPFQRLTDSSLVVRLPSKPIWQPLGCGQSCPKPPSDRQYLQRAPGNRLAPIATRLVCGLTPPTPLEAHKLEARVNPWSLAEPFLAAPSVAGLARRPTNLLGRPRVSQSIMIRAHFNGSRFFRRLPTSIQPNPGATRTHFRLFWLRTLIERPSRCALREGPPIARFLQIPRPIRNIIKTNAAPIRQHPASNRATRFEMRWPLHSIHLMRSVSLELQSIA